MFDGIAPNKYLQLFKMYADSRKNNDGSGNPKTNDINSPKYTLSLEAIPVLEGKITDRLKEKGLEKK